MDKFKKLFLKYFYLALLFFKLNFIVLYSHILKVALRVDRKYMTYYGEWKLINLKKILKKFH